MKKTILLLTDSLTLDREYIEELKKRYNVKVTSFSDAAFDYLVRKPLEISCFVLGIEDPMQKYKQFVSRASELRDVISRFPIIFWTSVDDEEVRDGISEMKNGFLVRPELNADHLALAVSDFVGDSK